MTTKKYSLRKVKVGVASVHARIGSLPTTGAVVAHAEGPTTATTLLKDQLLAI